MRIRIAKATAAVAATAVALTTVSACRSNVGYAATIEGQRYSESDISAYLTPDAKPVSRQDSSGAQVDVGVRAFVVETIVGVKLLTKVAANLPGAAAPSASVLDRLRTSVLQGASVDAAVRNAGIRGFTSRFDNLLVRRVVLSQYLQTASQQGVDVNTVLQRVPFSVSVNPRYGTWNAKTRTFDSSAGAGAPAFLTLQSGKSAGASSGN